MLMLTWLLNYGGAVITSITVVYALNVYIYSDKLKQEMVEQTDVVCIPIYTLKTEKYVSVIWTLIYV